MKNFLAVLALLTPRERKGAAVLAAISVAMAVFDTLGVASVMPFLAVVANPGFIESNPYLAAVYRFSGVGSREGFLTLIGFVTLAVVVGSAVFRAAAQYAVLRYVNMRRYSMSVRLLTKYLGQPYEFFFNRNSGDIAARVLAEVDQVVDGCLTPGVQLLAYTVVVVMLIGLLLAVDPLVAGFVGVLMGGFYAVTYAVNQRGLGRKGRERREANRLRFEVAAEAFGGIKEVKLFGREQPYIARFSAPSLIYARQRAASDLISIVPRYLIEAVAFGGALALTLVLMMTRQDIGEVLPILGLYAVAGYRLLPAAQMVYTGLARIRFSDAAVEAVLDDLRRPSEPITAPPPPMPFRRAIALEDVTYRYPTADRVALSHVEIEIAAGAAVGFIGATGAGKTTAVDLVLGLLSPASGRVTIDGVPLTTENRRAWQRNLGYVPQAIFLADATVAENIAFGIPTAEIDMRAVERAARIANIHDFVTTSLGKGYDTEIGERGIRLSGGQRQRVGIARALYHNPPVLVFDEATSALDTGTESAVMEAIGTLHGEKTIVIVAHRLSTTRGCDRIYTFRDGTVSENMEPRLVAGGEA